MGTPNLVGIGHLFGPQMWKDLGPVSFWSHGVSLSQVEFIKSNLYCLFPIVHGHSDRASPTYYRHHTKLKPQ